MQVHGGASTILDKRQRSYLLDQWSSDSSDPDVNSHIPNIFSIQLYIIGNLNIKY